MTDTSDDTALHVAYGESWALFHYLYKFNRQGMEDYLLAFLSHAPQRAIGPEERTRMFTKAFGRDIGELEKKFVAYVKTLPGK